jgi:hypothetical protein
MGAARALCLAVLLVVTQAAVAGPDDSSQIAVEIPAISTHEPFLYSDWQGDRANLLVFIDPLCPYCKKAIPKFDGITDYNVFVFWSPIFGDRSERAIEPLFTCVKPSSDALLHSLLNGTRDQVLERDCAGGEYDQNLREVNNRMVDSYQINSVPSFYLQGTRTSISRVYNPNGASGQAVNGVALKWARYENSKVIDNTITNYLAVILPSRFTQNQSELVSTYRPAYIFSDENWSEICKTINVVGCSGQPQTVNRKSYRELMALLGLESQEDYAYLIANDGSVRTALVN